jgi:valyl-tRNA synthetase
MKVGRKLATKLLNASKFVLGFGDADITIEPTHAVDQAMLQRLADVVDEATKAFESYDYARALERTESFFWWFCDDYVELVKTRAYATHGEDGALSARVALRRALSALHRLFAPILPFVTEEVWSWWQEGSVHRAPWPQRNELHGTGFTVHPDSFLDPVCATLGEIRRAKTEAKVSQRAVVSNVVVTGSEAAIGAITDAWPDIADAGSVQNWSTQIDEARTEPSVQVTLAPAEQ